MFSLIKNYSGLFRNQRFPDGTSASCTRCFFGCCLTVLKFELKLGLEAMERFVDGGGDLYDGLYDNPQMWLYFLILR